MTTSVTENEPLFAEACLLLQKIGKVNISLLQRHFKIGYDRALKLYQQLIAEKVVIDEVDEENYRRVNPEFFTTRKKKQ